MNEGLAEVNRLLDKIRSGRIGRDEVIVSLYNDPKLRNSFKKMINLQGWPRSAFDNIFTEAIISFTSSVIRRKDFVLNSDLTNYMLVIGKRAYVHQQKKVKSASPLDGLKEMKTNEMQPLDLILDAEQKDLINTILAKLGRNCREVLTYWANSYSMKEIATKMNYKSEMMARKKKYKCFKELTQLINENPGFEKILKSYE